MAELDHLFVQAAATGDVVDTARKEHNNCAVTRPAEWQVLSDDIRVFILSFFVAKETWEPSRVRFLDFRFMNEVIVSLRELVILIRRRDGIYAGTCT